MRFFTAITCCLYLLLAACQKEKATPQTPEQRTPNFILIFCDDLGYGDLGSYGSSINRTPNLDKMAAEGMRFASFYTSASVCTPSRASILTGCYPQRVDMAEVRGEGFRSVLLPAAQHGLNPKEITLAEMLKPHGYATACIGKWHLGDQPAFLPTRQGFDYYYGIPYSNNMDNGKGVPLMQGEKVIEQPVDQSTITKRYTEEAIQFIETHKEQPFFIYLPHTMPHAPLHASEDFVGRSAHGIYSDAIEELDWSTGKILDYLQAEGLAENTFVFFTSDNGGALHHGGVNKPLRAGKGTTWEGGMRVPGIAWWPGTVPAGRTSDALATVMDFMPTYHQLVTGKPFDSTTIDGHDLSPLLKGQTQYTPYKAFYYYDRDQLQAVRSGKWKLHLPLQNRFKAHHTDNGFEIGAELYDLTADIGEQQNVADQHPDVVETLTDLAAQAHVAFGKQDAPSAYIRPAGKVLSTQLLEK